MSPPPKGKHSGSSGQPERSHHDRTSAVVAVGLVALAVGGVLTVFSAPLLALVAPPTSDESGAQAAPSVPASGDGGATTTMTPAQGPDRDGHS